MRVIWFGLHREGGRRLHLLFPIPRIVILELLDSILDLLTVLSAFVPKVSAGTSRVSLHTAKDLVRMLIALFGSVTAQGPYDLAEISAGNLNLSIKIR